MSFSETLWPGIPPRSCPPCPASMTTVIWELLPADALRFLAAEELVARTVISRPATNKNIRRKFLRITGRLWAPRVGERTILVLCYPSFAQALRPCRRARLFRRCPNERGAAVFWFP